MIKNALYEKCINYNFAKLFESKGYAWFTKGAYNLNIVGIRKEGNKILNVYDDILIVDYNTPQGHKRVAFNITTEPGAFYMKHPLVKTGAAILVPNQYRGCWQLGLHKGKYKALCQAKAVQVYRDANCDNTYDLNPETVEKGMFGINIHRSAENYTIDKIDKYSAGCQVFNSPSDFRSFIHLCELQAKAYGNSFTYTLINESDLV